MKHILWGFVGVVGALALGAIAQDRGEPVNSAWLVIAAVCVYLLAYRFYGAFIAAKVFALDDVRQTPSERLADGRVQVEVLPRLDAEPARLDVERLGQPADGLHVEGRLGAPRHVRGSHERFPVDRRIE